MLEPLKIGLPVGAAVFSAFIIQLNIGGSDFTIVRWILVSIIGSFAAYKFYHSKLTDPRSFRDIWFSGFSALAVSSISYVLLIWVFKSFIFEYLEMIDMLEYYSLMIIEFQSQFMFFILTHSVLTFIYRKI